MSIDTRPICRLTLGRHVGRHSTYILTDTRPITRSTLCRYVDRHLADMSVNTRRISQAVCRHSTGMSIDTQPISRPIYSIYIHRYIDRYTRPSVYRYIGRVSTNMPAERQSTYRSSVDNISVECRPTCLPTVDRRIGRVSIDISAVSIDSQPICRSTVN